MKVLEWKTAPEDREAFKQFINDRLDEEDNAKLQRFAQAVTKVAENLSDYSKLNEQADAERLANRHGGTISWPEDKGSAGRKPPKGHYGGAVRDVHRIRDIFKRFWPSEVRRNTAPSAEQIAIERWNLSAADAERLQKRFEHKSL